MIPMILNEVQNSLLIWGSISTKGLSRIKEEARLVVVPENRPWMIGLIHNIPLLMKEDIPAVYCTDNMLGLLFYRKKVKKTLLFYKEQNEEGIMGISGSLYATLLSRLHQIPIEIVEQGKLECHVSDKDATSLGRKEYILAQDDAVIAAEDELIEWELLT